MRDIPDPVVWNKGSFKPPGLANKYDDMSYSKNRSELIDEMEMDYGYIFCQWCKRSNAFGFDVHHIVFRSEKPRHPMLHNKANLIIVCRDCHKDFHSNKNLRESLMLERGLNEMFNINNK